MSAAHWLHLGDTLASLVTTQKFETIILLTLATAALAFRSPISLAVLPTLAWRFLSDNTAYWGPGLALQRRAHADRIRRAHRRAAARQALQTLLASRLRAHRGADHRGLCARDAAAAAACRARAARVIPAAARRAVAAMAKIPDDATVSSDLTYLAYLASRDDRVLARQPGQPGARLPHPRSQQRVVGR